MKYLSCLAAVCVVGVLITGCASTDAELQHADALIRTLRNSDITWEKTEFGPRPEATGKPAVELLRLGRVANEPLFDTLKDPDKTLAVHVILTKLNLTRYRLTDNSWNGIHLRQTDAGYSPSKKDIGKIVDFWSEELGYKEIIQTK